VCNQEGRKVLTECAEINMQGKIQVHNMPCTLQEWLQEIVCHCANWTEFAEIGWSVLQDVLKLLAAEGQV